MQLTTFNNEQAPKLGMLAHAYNPSYLGGRDKGGLQFEANLGKKVCKTLFQPIKNWV
jgi:hypothetical protein